MSRLGYTVRRSGPTRWSRCVGHDNCLGFRWIILAGKLVSLRQPGPLDDADSRTTGTPGDRPSARPVRLAGAGSCVATCGITVMREFDVVVVGGGGSGLAVAARSVELGLSVAVLEKQPSLGGTTGVAVGSFTANRTRHQARAGVSDSLNDHVEDAGKFATPAIESRNNDELRRFFLTHAAATLDWLEGIGLSFHGPSPEPPNRVPRMHNVIPNAKSYISALQSRVLRGGGQIHCRSAVARLVKSGNRVTGVAVVRDGAEIVYGVTRGVVLAAGDYANSRDLIARFKGTEFSAIVGINPDAQGDGHRLAEEAGARLVNMDITYGPELRFVPSATKWTNFSQLLPTSGWAARILGSLSPLVPRRLLNEYVKRLLVTWQHPEDKLFNEVQSSSTKTECVSATNARPPTANWPLHGNQTGVPLSSSMNV